MNRYESKITPYIYVIDPTVRSLQPMSNFPLGMRANEQFSMFHRLLTDAVVTAKTGCIQIRTSHQSCH